MAIIAISGRMHSGKDTVATIIQQLTAIHLRVEDEFGRTIDGEIEYKNTWQVKRFAGKLKKIASMLTGIPVEKFEDQEFKKTQLGREWNNMTVREFLQRLGTDCVRDNLHTNTWVNALFSDYIPWVSNNKELSQCCHHHNPIKCERSIKNYPNWIITDCRFPNEYQAIKDHDGFIVRINRGKYIKGDETLHTSETSLDSYDFDYIIENNDSIDHLRSNVSDMLVDMGYL